MIQRSLRYVLGTLVVLALILGGGYWYLKRPAPEPTLELLTPADGAAMTRVIPEPRHTPRCWWRSPRNRSSATNN